MQIHFFIFIQTLVFYMLIQAIFAEEMLVNFNLPRYHILLLDYMISRQFIHFFFPHQNVFKTTLHYIKE